MKQVKITKEKFEAYKRVREMPLVDASRFTEMIKMVRHYCNINLTKDECFDIYRKYSEYNKQFKKNE